MRHACSLDHEDDDTCEAMHRLLDAEGIEVLVATQANDMGHAIRRTPDAERIEVWPECRVSLVNPSGGSCRRTDSLLGDSLYRPGPPRSGVGCATSSLLRSCSGSATPCANGLTACRMRSAYRLRGSGTIAPSPLRRYARAYAYRRLPALASLSMAGSG